MTAPFIKSKSRINLLDAISRYGPITAKQLQKKLGIKSSALYALLQALRLDREIYIACYDTSHKQHPNMYARGNRQDAPRPSTTLTPEQRRDRERERNRLRYAANRQAERERNKANRAKRAANIGAIAVGKVARDIEHERIKQAAILKNATMLPFSW